MAYNDLIRCLRKTFYVTSYERFESKHSDRKLERYVAKHPLLTPKLIVVNDQAHGFRRISSRLQSLEEFPIYCEIEFYASPEVDRAEVVDIVDLYSEVHLSLKGGIQKLNDLVAEYDDYVIVERSKRIGSPEISSILIYSKLGELFLERFFEEELLEGLIQTDELETLITEYLQQFTKFIKVFDETFFKRRVRE